MRNIRPVPPPGLEPGRSYEPKILNLVPLTRAPTKPRVSALAPAVSWVLGLSDPQGDPHPTHARQSLGVSSESIGLSSQECA